jgi:phage terminase large subunit
MVEIRVKRIPKHYRFLKGTRHCAIVCCWGGAGSGKSHGICQEMVDRMLEEKDIFILIVRKTGPSLTHTTYKMIMDILKKEYQMVEGVDFHVNKTEKTLKIGNNEMWFTSFDDKSQEKKKSLNINYCYIEEATELSWDDYLQIDLRLRRENINKDSEGRVYPAQLILSWNPTDAWHWTKLEMLDKCDGKVKAQCHSTWQDNPFLPADYIQKLQRLKEVDPAYYQMYTEGNYTKIANVIYHNYAIEKWQPFKVEQEPFAYGVDFGFNHPTVLLALWHINGEVWVQELLYSSGLTNQDFIARMAELIPWYWRHVPIYADAAEPARIEEINKAQGPNPRNHNKVEPYGFICKPAQKSIKDGIDRVKRFKLHLHEDGVNLIREIRGYKWKEKIINGEAVAQDEPVGLNDHAMDAMRYAIYSSNLAPAADADFSVESLLKTSRGTSPHKRNIPSMMESTGGNRYGKQPVPEFR